MIVDVITAVLIAGEVTAWDVLVNNCETVCVIVMGIATVDAIVTSGWVTVAVCRRVLY